MNRARFPRINGDDNLLELRINGDACLLVHALTVTVILIDPVVSFPVGITSSRQPQAVDILAITQGAPSGDHSFSSSVDA